MEKKKDSRYQRVGRIALQAAIVTLLAFLFSMLIMQPMSFSVMSIFSSPEKSDTSVTDLYAQVADRRPVRTLDPDVVLVDIDRADRAQIAEILDEINLWSPRVVGLDVIFAAPGEDDSELLRAISESDRIVLPIGLESVGFDKSDKSDESDESGISGKSKNPEKSSKAGISEVFRVSDAQFFYPPGGKIDDSDFEAGGEAGDVVYAAINLPGAFKGATIREFATTFQLPDGRSVDSFPLALAKAYRPGSDSLLKIRNRRYETIDYPSREFITLHHSELDLRGAELTDKLVLVGALSDAADMHSTPINSYMSGLSIHAASISTILGNRYYDPADIFPDWLPACLLCFSIILLRDLLRVEMRGIITRLLQLVIIYLTVRIGYALYVDRHMIFDLSYTMLMVTFGFFAADIWVGVKYIGGASGAILSNAYSKIRTICAKSKP